MIPDEVREEIKRALDLALENCLGPYRQFMADDEDYLNELEDDPDIQSIRNAQRWLDKPYSHRNGETEPPEVEGYYWFQWEDAPSWLCVEVRDAGYDNEMSLVALWPGLQTPDYIDSIVGRWYGPIPEPQQENNAE